MNQNMVSASDWALGLMLLLVLVLAAYLLYALLRAEEF